MTESRNPSASARLYERALEIDPEHVGAALNLAAILIAADEPAPARRLLRRLLAADPAASELTPEERDKIAEFLSDG